MSRSIGRIWMTTLMLLAGAAPAIRAQTGAELGADVGFGVISGSGTTLVQLQTPTAFRIGLPVSDRFQLEPRVNLTLVSGGGSTVTALTGTGAVMWRLDGTRSRGAYLAVLPEIHYFDVGSGSSTQFALGAGVGYRIPQGDRWGFRLEAQFLHAFETDEFAGTDSFTGLFGVSFFTH